ncbi:MAG: hypothetical protein Q9217_003753 [Psora testacea]
MNAPPPPPHGSNGNPRSGLPDGSYDIFIVPPHSSGGGFIYFPSLQTNRNSFLAGAASALLAMMLWSIIAPTFKDWTSFIAASGGYPVIILLLAAGIAGWAWGKTQVGSGGSGQGSAGGPPRPQPAGHPEAGPTPGPTPGPPPGPPPGPTPGYAPGHTPGYTPGPTPGYPPGPTPGYTSGHTPGYTPGPTPGYTPRPTPGYTPRPTSGYTPQPEPRQPPPSWQRTNTGPASGTANAGTSKSGWEKAREETRKKEEERKKAEELKKKRESDERERVRQRERDAREKEAREKREKEAREKLEKEVREKIDKEEREKREKEAREKREKETARNARPSSPSKNHRHPTAKTATDDASSYSYRPYDKPNRPGHKPASASSIYSESSYAPSQSTSRTTPPPSRRGPYRSKDPDKIVIKAVYSFNNVFTKTPIAKLVSGMGSVTDGLILRVTTEGLFIDDDVRGVPQREWDVKAWTLKLVEVWCPHLLALGASSGSSPGSRAAAAPPGMFGKKWASRAPTHAESESFLEAVQQACKPCLSNLRSKSDTDVLSQSGEFKGLHVLRASIRDPEGKRYVVVLQEEEGWKVAVGLQRLRRGTQVRALGVSGMPTNETKAILENMGWI